MIETIKLACWECNAIYGADKAAPKCPNCGWVPDRLVLTRDDVWADPKTVVVGVPYEEAERRSVT
jgi:hypothetical protein